jgi:serine O-acetyltransferase
MAPEGYWPPGGAPPRHTIAAVPTARAAGPGAWAALRDDFRANAPELPERPGRGQLVRAVARNAPTVRFLAVALLRLAQGAGARVGLLGSLLKQLNHVLTGADLAYQAQVGPGLVLYHPTGVVLGPHCRVGVRATVMQGVTVGSDEVVAGAAASGSPVIGDDVFIGPGAAIFGAVTLGDRVQVGANSVVASSFGDDVVIAGAPARVVRER